MAGRTPAPTSRRCPITGRYELVDGTLVVTPAPSLKHRIAVVNLVLVLGAACSDELRVLTAPFDVALGQ